MNGRLLLLQLTIVVILLVISETTTAAVEGAAPPNCKEKCGAVTIPYPFGIADRCYLHVPDQEPDHQPFKIHCNSTNRQLQFLYHDRLYNITNISLDKSELQVMVASSRYCIDTNGKVDFNLIRGSEITLARYYGISYKNYVVSVGCNRIAMLASTFQVLELKSNPWVKLSGLSSCYYALGEQFPNDCSGFGCSQSPIRAGSRKLELYEMPAGLGSDEDESTDSSPSKWSLSYPCSYGFIVDQRNFTFQGNKTFDQLAGPRQELPVLFNWVIGNDTCANASFACKHVNAECVDRAPKGYFCRCNSGYRGNPYLLHGCQDIDECTNSTSCGAHSTCINSVGNYTCECHKGYIPFDRRNCVKGGDTSNTPMKISLGVCLSFLMIVLIAFWIYRGIKIRKLKRLKIRYFKNNGGDQLRKMMENSKGSPPVKLYTYDELKQATKNFNNNERIGEGAYGSVYKGTLPDKSTVAIKVPKNRDPLKESKKANQFANELMILSRITHRNVVKLLGCCLETEMPILVYEFINNGTVFEHIHNPKDKQLEPLSFPVRLKIATETASSLVYLHYDHDPQIIHRDVKTTNILVDDNFTAKVSDFGASKFVFEDQNLQATCLQGTQGYLDPEYLQSNILTDKSDVYSFGVVLVELITSQAAISITKPEEERNLAKHFITSMNEDRLHQILDLDIIKEDNVEVAEKVALLALKCLSLKGSERPTMIEVFTEIKAIWKYSPNQFPPYGRPDASPKEADTMLSTPSPSDSYHGIASANYDQSLPDDASMIRQPIDGGR